MTEVLTRAEGMKMKTLPTGRVLDIFPLSQAGLYKIGYADKKPGTLPAKYSGMYTSKDRAEHDLKKYLTDFWNTSDQATKSKK